MKKIKLIITSLVAALALNSCSEDDLTLFPPLADPLDTAINTEDDLQAILVGGYNEASSANLFGANLLIYGDLMSDNTFVSNTNDGYFTNVNNLNFSPQTDLGILGTLYRMKVYSNIVLNHDLPVTQNVLNIEGQAHMMRAVALYYAVSLFSSNPTSNQYLEYGVPVYTGPYDPSANYPRATVQETYNQIILDLEQAIAKMNQPINGNKGYFSPTAAKLLLSRVHLTVGNYQAALDYATDVINNSPSQFGFVSSADYVDYFSSTDVTKTENRPETVWEINFTATDNPGTNAAIGAFYPRNGSHASLLFRQDFVNSFGPNDIRKGLFTTTNVPASDDPTGVWTTKWPRATTEGNFTINVKVFRMSEAKLNRIEALYRLGQTAQALAELNDFAASRNGETYSGADLLNDILTERRREFFAEGQRFYDLKRNNLGYVKTTNCAGGICDIPANSKYFVMPMPETSEILLNPLMTQHPLWQ